MMPKISIKSVNFVESTVLYISKFMRRQETEVLRISLKIIFLELQYFIYVYICVFC